MEYHPLVLPGGEGGYSMLCGSCHRPYLFLHPPGVRCRGCGFESESIPWPSYAGYHERRFGSGRSFYQRTPRTDPEMREVLAALALSPGHRVLELGCGIGDYCREIERRECAVVGVDRQVGVARGRFHQLALAEMDAAGLGFRPAAFDRVSCVNTIEHVREPERLLAEVRRVLRPEGRVVLTTFNYSFFLHRLLYDETHLWEWTQAEFESLVARYFTLVEVRRSGSFFRYYPLNLLLARVLKPELLAVGEKR